MRVLVSDPGALEKEMMDLLVTAAEECVRQEGLDPESVEISLSFVSEEEIQQLNRDYRGVDSVTDVLSFPLLEDPEVLFAVEEDEEAEDLALGDVVICLAKADEQAKEFGHSRQREIGYLFVHSVLHLLGYDHMEAEDKALMRAQEEKICSLVGLERILK